MSLDRLPEEILRIILKQLDMKTVNNLFDTGNQHIQNAICTLYTWRLSLSSLATVNTLQLDFFKAISHNLQELDLSAVQGLSKTKLLPAIKKMPCLEILNIAYTKITIFDFLEIYAKCPTIKDITINFLFHSCNELGTYSSQIFPEDKLNKCRNMFEKFVNVHFVGSADNLFYGNMAVNLLQKAKLNCLTYTVAQQNNKIFTYFKNVQKKVLNCNKIIIKILFAKKECSPKSFTNSPNIIRDLPFEYEYVHIDDFKINVSPAFGKYFRENFSCNKIYVAPKISSLLNKTNQCYMIWNKETTNFNDAFFRDLACEVRKLRPDVITCSEKMPVVTLKNDWVCVCQPLLQERLQRTEDSNGFRKKRVTSSNITIDYDNLFEDKKNIELSLCFEDHVYCAATLSSSSNYLKKLTFLQLRGSVRYSAEFFNILFRCCENLITLDVEAIPVSPCAPPISRSVPLSRSIKNLRIVDKSIDLNTLFLSLSQCPMLENIMIIDRSNLQPNITYIDTLLKQCDKLYYLCIGGSMSDNVKSKKLTILNKAREKYNRHHLCIEIINSDQPNYCYDPFVDVYRLVVNLGTIL